ncbi:pentapeptide repeat-containing protein, partial [Streptomyces sp. NPDC048491]
SEPDFGGASLVRVEFHGCELRGADFTGARLKDVDLRGATLLDIARGVERLAGAVISPSQLLDLAPAFAAQVGVRVEA